MGCPVLREDSSRAHDCAGEGWYLLRRGGVIEGRRYSAGAVLECDDTSWFLHDDNCRVKLTWPLNLAMLYQGALDGLSLYVVERVKGSGLSARRLFHPEDLIHAEVHLIGASLEPQETMLCVRFGCCFFPLDYFGW